MYAIIRIAGKQYRVQPDTTLTVNKLAGSAGDSIDIAEVLAIGGEGDPVFGKPTVPNATVAATIVEHTRGPKIDGFTYKAKKNIRRHYGHRQDLTKIKIGAISHK
ncbi:MAG TPA: 50S ribosomal protein L21 [Capsulimonadaceae bacterium]|nr:50S ribosomal protein L21 [Capsulimonadaceae bacterium]